MGVLGKEPSTRAVRLSALLRSFLEEKHIVSGGVDDNIMLSKDLDTFAKREEAGQVGNVFEHQSDGTPPYYEDLKGPVLEVEERYHQGVVEGYLHTP